MVVFFAVPVTARTDGAGGPWWRRTVAAVTAEAFVRPVQPKTMTGTTRATTAPEPPPVVAETEVVALAAVAVGVGVALTEAMAWTRPACASRH